MTVVLTIIRFFNDQLKLYKGRVKILNNNNDGINNKIEQCFVF